MPARWLLPIALFLLASPSPTCTAQPDTAMDPTNTSFDLDDYQWKNRLLLVFAPSAKSPAYEEQLQLLEAEDEGFAERDLLLGRLLNQGRSHVGEQPVGGEAAAQLRQRFDVEGDQFRIIMVGKDGTEKRRDDAAVKPSVIYEEIDAMPMRQREMRRQQQ